MQIMCSKDNLAKGAQTVGRAVAARGVLPVLSNILLETEEDRVYLTATDLEMGIRTSFPATVTQRGTVTVPARTLTEIIGRLPDADVEISSINEGAETTLICQKARFTLRGLPAGEFPQLPVSDAKPTVVFDSSLLLKAIRLTSFATATDDAKSTLSGVFLHLDHKRLEMAATDGYRLACYHCDLPKNTKTTLQLIIPTRSLAELARLLGTPTDGEKVSLTLANNQSVWQVGDRVLTSRLIDGQYPNYQQIIPGSFERQTRLKRQDFLAAVERVSIMASDRTNNIVRLHLTDKELLAQAGTPDLGNASEGLEVAYEGEPFQIAFNAKYLLDAIRHQETEDLQFDLGTPLSPALLHAADQDDYICLLMPVRAERA